MLGRRIMESGSAEPKILWEFTAMNRKISFPVIFTLLTVHLHLLYSCTEVWRKHSFNETNFFYKLFWQPLQWVYKKCWHFEYTVLMTLYKICNYNQCRTLALIDIGRPRYLIFLFLNFEYHHQYHYQHKIGWNFL